MKFELNGKKYDFVWYSEFTEDMLPENKNYKKSKYLDIGSGFDIETTNLENEKKDHVAIMWCWQWSFNELTIIGRTWEEFKECYTRIVKWYKMDKEHKMLVFIHNAPFEFSFMRKYLPISRLLAKSKREVMTFTTDDFMEFRDSLVLTRFSLAKMATNYKLGLDKLKGDLDYSIIRHPESDFRNLEEIAYCINDVQILQRFFHRYIKSNFIRMGYKIPLTQTGVPRMEIKRALKKMGAEYVKKYREFIARCYPSKNMYINMRRYLFRGGYTHSSNIAINNMFSADFWEQFRGFDRKSSYPAEVLNRKHPTQYFAQDPSWFWCHFDEPESFFEDIGFIGFFKIKNIKAKYPHSIESQHKLVDWSDDAIFDNGRLMQANAIYVMLSEWDYLNYCDFYRFKMKDMECIWIKVTRKEFLPEFITKTTYSYFLSKETLPKDTVEYARSKEKLNSIFGMMATGLPETEYIFYNGELVLSNDESLPDDIRKEPKPYEELIKKQFLLPQWAISICGAARRELLKMVLIAPYDSLYCDTDSDKLRNWNQYLPQIAAYNKRMEERNKATAARLGVDFEIIKDLGKFMPEDEYSKFKTLGAKRYLYETLPDAAKHKPSEIHAVVAGMERGSFLAYCDKNKLDPFQAFKPNLYLAPEFSRKITSAYTDAAFDIEVTDYAGRTMTVHEECCCALYEIPFSMKVDPDFLALAALMKKQDARRREIYKDVL